MTIPLNSSGLPQGTGSLQVRGRVYWMIYTDETGRKIQENTQTSDLFAARQVLARTAIKVMQARLSALRSVLHEAHHAARTAAGNAGREGSVRSSAAADARGRKTHSQGGVR